MQVVEKYNQNESFSKQKHFKKRSTKEEEMKHIVVYNVLPKEKSYAKDKNSSKRHRFPPIVNLNFNNEIIASKIASSSYVGDGKLKVSSKTYQRSKFPQFKQANQEALKRGSSNLAKENQYLECYTSGSENGQTVDNVPKAQMTCTDSVLIDLKVITEEEWNKRILNSQVNPCDILKYIATKKHNFTELDGINERLAQTKLKSADPIEDKEMHLGLLNKPKNKLKKRLRFNIETDVLVGYRGDTIESQLTTNTLYRPPSNVSTKSSIQDILNSNTNRSLSRQSSIFINIPTGHESGSGSKRSSVSSIPRLSYSYQPSGIRMTSAHDHWAGNSEIVEQWWVYS